MEVNEVGHHPADYFPRRRVRGGHRIERLRLGTLAYDQRSTVAANFVIAGLKLLSSLWRLRKGGGKEKGRGRQQKHQHPNPAGDVPYGNCSPRPRPLFSVPGVRRV